MHCACGQMSACILHPRLPTAYWTFGLAGSAESTTRTQPPDPCRAHGVLSSPPQHTPDRLNRPASSMAGSDRQKRFQTRPQLHFLRTRPLFDEAFAARGLGVAQTRPHQAHFLRREAARITRTLPGHMCPPAPQCRFGNAAIQTAVAAADQIHRPHPRCRRPRRPQFQPAGYKKFVFVHDAIITAPPDFDIHTRRLNLATQTIDNEILYCFCRYAVQTFYLQYGFAASLSDPY